MAAPYQRLIALILIRCALRISDTLRLKQDIIQDKDGAPQFRTGVSGLRWS